ncbi:hypothetical protein S245_036892 [Arachis hypogaea]
MIESTGKTNCTGVLSRSNLVKAYNEWLHPFRTLVSGIMTENKDDYDQLVVDIVCTLNPLEARASTTNNNRAMTSTHLKVEHLFIPNIFYR